MKTRTLQSFATALLSAILLAGCTTTDDQQGGSGGPPQGRPGGSAGMPPGGPGGSGGMAQGGPGGAGQAGPGQGGAPRGPQAATLARQATSKYFTDLGSATADINAQVDALYDKGLFRGWAPKFQPAEVLTRGELASLLTLRYQGKAQFSSDRADEAVTREEAAQWIYEAEVAHGMPSDMATTELKGVKDAASVSPSARKAVATLVRLGVLKTDAGSVLPQGTFTRAQIVPSLYQLWSLGGAPGGAGQGPGAGVPPGGAPGMAQGNNSVDQGTTANTVTSSVAGLSYSSQGDTENALRVTGSTKVTLAGVTVTKSAGAAGSGDSSSFYGNNAAVLVTGGAQATFTSPRVTSATKGANGIFVYGTGTKATVANAVIRTTGDASGGVMVAGGGAASVTNADVDTQGGSSAAIRSDRGGGTLTVDGGTYTSHGNGSPAVYSTATITVKNATLSATGSEAVVVEGKNSVVIENSTVTGHMVKDDVESIHNVMIYQSMSGDAAVGHGSFTMVGGSLTSLAGDMFYVTNTTATLSLTNVKLTPSSSVLLKVVGNDARRGWGKVGSNGGELTFAATQQALAGTMVVDAISKLNLVLAQGSTFSGTINEADQQGTVAVTLDATSTWSLTGDAHVTSFQGNLDNVVTNGHALWVNGKKVK